MPDVLLEMKGIGKTFGATAVLEDVAFTLHAGEVHMLAGENGAGKSTLMRILSGIYTEYAGEMTVRGETVRFHSPQEAARCGITIIHQELSLIPSMRVADNIFLGREETGSLGRLRFKEERKACMALLQRLGVDAQPEATTGDYPISVQQSIEIAKALAFDASIIVMDEPTSALTAPEVERLFTVIQDLKASGCGIIYISHKMEEIYRIADRITVLRDGHCIGTAEARDLPEKALIRWMVGRDMEEQFAAEKTDPGAEALVVRDFTVPDPGGCPRPAVRNASFSVRAGEIVGLAGLQGSGAEALLNGLYGVYGRTVRGTVLVDGKPYAPISPRHALNHGVVLLSSDRKREGLVLSMSIAHNITLACLPEHSQGGWLREGREHALADACRRQFGIRAESSSQPVSALSGGNQQKVVLAKCLAAHPRVLLLNEPTRGVDVGAKQEIYGMMRQWTQEGIAMVLITSEMPELLALSDRLVVLHQGGITARLQRSEATPEAVLSAAMGSVDTPNPTQGDQPL